MMFNFNHKQIVGLMLCICLTLMLFPSLGFAADAKLNASAVSASSDDGNVPGNTVDGDLNTRWSANGDGQWIKYDLGSSKKVSYIKIAFYNGSTRTSTFDIQTSTDNTNFSTVQSNVTSTLSDALQTFNFTDVDPARYVRIVGHGNSSNTWNSYTEVEIYGDVSSSGTAVNVSTAAQLTTAINNATAGTTIVLANGTYNGPFSISNKNGTASSQILIRSANQSQAIISGSGGFTLSNSSYVTIQGLKFTNQGTAVALSSSDHNRITRNQLALATNTAATKWIVLNGTGSNNNWIDHNEFGPRHDLGQMISIDGSGGQVAQYTLIEYNYFHDADVQTSNGGETIRVGLSGLSMSDGFNTIQNNLFVNCDSDAEVVSVKSKNNTVRYNTFRNNSAQVTARHGHSDSFYGNFFFGDGAKASVGGFRIYGNDHKIYNNYFENLTSAAINIDGGDFDAGSAGTNYTSANLTAHWRVYRAQVTNNTVVNSTGSSLAVGLSFTYAPVDSVIANNIAKSSTGTLYNEAKTSNTVFEGNIGYGTTLNNASRTSAEIRNINPLFTTSNGLQKLSSTSPALDAAVGSYAYVTEDMDGQVRATKDVGADEYSTAPIVRQPLTSANVGPNAP
ncbi:discoidin domain-containing protein [Paenibacillus sp. WQ 127069]|uniref:Discoidin domain-containing protein n=2 Tax=Paenibacillus baimaensis TaxID=2982185 RepID=A0ABT2UDM7_9BACL|nr:discoidin domain-containing protein [Paenibacillus sp. WQ 127069]